jgi:L-fucose mutarotase/ribose pyranase (RbsD/FucU family)
MLHRTLASAVLLFAAACQTADWRADLRQQLKHLGHRNLIAVVDSAYPAQTAAGITTRYIGGDQVYAVQVVLDAVHAAGHVQCRRAVLDKELDAVAETAAPGISEYRARLRLALTAAMPIRFLPHQQIIQMLATSAKDFEVLVLKTDLRLPYTSVFLWLDCGYWDDEREDALRETMAK